MPNEHCSYQPAECNAACRPMRPSAACLRTVEQSDDQRQRGGGGAGTCTTYAERGTSSTSRTSTFWAHPSCGPLTAASGATTPCPRSSPPRSCTKSDWASHSASTCSCPSIRRARRCAPLLPSLVAMPLPHGVSFRCMAASVAVPPRRRRGSGHHTVAHTVGFISIENQCFLGTRGSHSAQCAHTAAGRGNGGAAGSRWRAVAQGSHAAHTGRAP